MDDREYIKNNLRVVNEFRASGGKVQGWGALLLLTIKGAKSGIGRVYPLMSVPFGDHYLAVGSRGGSPEHPQWYYNLLAHPDVTVEIENELFLATARLLSGEERERAFARAVEVFPPYGDYQKKTTRQIPVFLLERRVIQPGNAGRPAALTFRPATPDDAQAIALINLTVGQTAYQGILPQQELTPELIEQASIHMRDELEGDAQEEDTATYVAEDASGEILGYASGGPNREGPPAYSGELYNLFVLQQYQRQGIGSRLFLQVLAFLRGKGHSSLLLWVIPSTEAVKYYESLKGQQVTERAESVEALQLSIPFVCYGWPDLAALEKVLQVKFQK